jgi:transcription elongation factor Elf1
MKKKIKKTRKRIIKQAVPKVETVFDCPFCSHKRCIFVEIDKRKKIAKIKCKICFNDYSQSIKSLTEPIDVYYDWLDKCVEINNKKEKDDNSYFDEDEEDKI